MGELRPLVREVRRRLLATRDSVCLERARLVTEAYRQFADDPPPLRRAKAFAHVLAHMTLDVSSNPVFAGNTSSRPRAWMLIPEHGFALPPQVLLENDGLDHILDDLPADLREFWAERSFGGNQGIGHLAVDMETVVHRGLVALLDDLRRCEGQGKAEQRTYRQAMAIALQAVIDWAQRYADAAESASTETSDPLLRRLHQRVAQACRRVPAFPARDLFEGLQAMVLVHLAVAIEGHGMSVSIGLPDRVLEPFINDDFDADEATDLVAAFMLKITANSVFGRGSKTQAITVGGADHLGRDRCNALTACFLEACNLVRVGDPPLFLRWHPGIDRAIERRAVELLARGLSMPLLVNDLPTTQGFLDAGVSPQDAWEYCVIGCNELGIPGRSALSASAMFGQVQHLALLNEVLLETDDLSRFTSMSDLLAAVEQRMADQLRLARQQGHAHRLRLAQEVPTPFTSALMRGCIERGEDLLVGMKYQMPGVYERGLTNAANALAAIDEVVFGRRELTLAELVEALRENFPDAPLRARLLQAPKWGNDDDRADRWALELVAMRDRVLSDLDREFGDSPHMLCHVVRSLHHLDGQRIAASPDGRLAGTPVADSIGAQTGTAWAGPTAILNSVLKLDAARYYRGGYNLNLLLPPGTATEATLAVLRAFFEQGGQELQIACYDAQTLRAAQANPEEYGDLVVRFAGLSSRFIDLSRVEQDELIERAEAMQASASRVRLCGLRPAAESSH
ncbi:MAG: hypothetical protein J7M26_05875 [Armatimonadetes bacterium]|nr:hypothetical protein [Armatimonadota bacterium]